MLASSTQTDRDNYMTMTMRESQVKGNFSLYRTYPLVLALLALSNSQLTALLLTWTAW